MRQLRTAAVLLALSLLTSAATAYAECAWVLDSPRREAAMKMRESWRYQYLPDTVDPRRPKGK
jgi:hypothetical protein